MNKLFELFNVKKKIENYVQSRINTSLYEYKEKEKKKIDNDKRLIVEATYPIGELYICISNEWCPLMLVEVIDYQVTGTSTLPIIKDINTGKEYLAFSKLIGYTEALLDIYLPLNPFQRYSAVTGQDITGKQLFIDPDGVKNELSKEEFIQLANNWNKTRSKPSCF